MFKQNNPLGMQRELTGVSRALGAARIRTTFQGTGAHAVGNVINVPAMKLDAELDDYQMRIMRGYHIHEVGHVKHTDDGVWQKECQSLTDDQRGVFNCMEDIFVERKINEKYLGAKRNLQDTINSVLEIENAQNDCMHDPIDKELGYAILQLSRQAMGYKSDALDEYVDTLPEDLYMEANKFLSEALGANSTADTWSLTQKVLTAMNEAKKKNPRKQKAQAKNPKKPCKDGKSKSPRAQPADDKQETMPTPSSDQSNEEKDGERKKDQGQGSAGKGEIDPNEKMQRGKSNGQGTGDAGYGHLDMGTLLEDVLSEHINPDADSREWYDDDGDVRMVSMCASRDVGSGYDMKLNGVKADQEDENGEEIIYDQGGEMLDERYRKDMQDLGGEIRTKCQRVARLLIAENNSYWEGSKPEGRLDRRRLSGVVAGDQNVWRKLHREETKNVGISVMMDTSGSMDFDEARQGLIVFNECLYRTSVKYRFVWWQSSQYTYVCKREDERGNSDIVKRKIALTGDWSGGTSPVPAILPELFHLQNMEVDRRMMFFCTDGGFSNHDFKYVKFYIQMAKQVAGTEVYGVFIGCDPAYDEESKRKMDECFVDGWMSVESVAFAKSMLEGLEKLLLGK